LNAGAADSEDEDDLVSHDKEHAQEVNEHMEESLAALFGQGDYVESSADPNPDENGIAIQGAPPGWMPPVPPPSFDPNKPPKTNKGEPEFIAVDNPGNWPKYAYQAQFHKNGTYSSHALPTGATPVPADGHGKRVWKDWEFHYKGWYGPDDVPYRSGATRSDPFPANRKGCMDKEKLTKLGLTKERMDCGDGRPDALFWYQLILPMCDPKQSGVPGDGRKAFYTEVEWMSNVYAMGQLRMGMSYGHAYLPTNAAELLRWDGVVAMDGVKGGSDGAILRRFNKDDKNTAYCPYIANAFTKTRWLQLKRVFKLNDNATEKKKKGEPGYDPAYKYNMIFDVIIANVNYITKYAALDLCGDETTYAHEGYGEDQSGLVHLIMGKPGVTCGGQIIVVNDVGRIRPRAYTE
jgi:hypothetical protein